MKIRILIVLIASVFALSANSATLVIRGGQLVGATNVNVDGALYDVSFLDGSCNSLYSGCSDFTFDALGALLASRALLAQVLQGNQYDWEPELTNGIEDVERGYLFTPYDGSGQRVKAYAARNNYGGVADGDGTWSNQADFSLAEADWGTYAVWGRDPNVVPLPAAAWLFMSAIAVLAGGQRISRSKWSV